MQNFFVKSFELLGYVTRVYEVAMEKQGVTGLPLVEASALLALFQQDGLKASDLARSVGRAATSFTSIIDNLVERGFVERRKDDDRRSIRVCLTAHGETLREPLQQAFTNAEAVFANSILDYLPLPKAFRVIKPPSFGPAAVATPTGPQGEGVMEARM